MSPVIGFVLLTHNKPDQIIRLIERLDHMFNRPLIALHHDFSQCDLPTATFQKNVSFVNPSSKTTWGGFEIVEGTLRSLDKLLKLDDRIDWFTVLSGSDYPIKSATKILDDLKTSPYDAHIDIKRLDYKKYDTEWHKECYDRYVSKTFRLPYVNRNFRLSKFRINVRHPLISSRFNVFNDRFRCFAGSQWFSANRRAVEFLVEFHQSNPRIAQHFKKTHAPDESYIHTILANNTDLRLSLYDVGLRYVDWSQEALILQGRLPKELTMDDLSKLIVSKCHFARKFDTDRDNLILTELDKIIDK